MLAPNTANVVAIASTALITIGEGALAVAAANPVTVGAVAVGVGGYCLYNAFLKNDKAQEYNHLKTILDNQDYDNFIIQDNDDNRIGRFEKKKHGNIDSKLKDNASAPSATGMPEPEDEGPDNNEHDSFEDYINKLKKGEKVDGSKIKYHNAKYHHHQSSGLKSKPPTNPQEALKNVYKVKDGTQKQLIGIDFENNQIVIFRHTGNNNYHGHITTFNELKDVAQRKLLENLAKTDSKIARMIK